MFRHAFESQGSEEVQIHHGMQDRVVGRLGGHVIVVFGPRAEAPGEAVSCQSRQLITAIGARAFSFFSRSSGRTRESHRV